jgi:hypothetical protein
MTHRNRERPKQEEPRKEGMRRREGKNGRWGSAMPLFLH